MGEAVRNPSRNVYNSSEKYEGNSTRTSPLSSVVSDLSKSSSQIHSPWMEDLVDSSIGLSFLFVVPARQAT
jgi:hypothetical protein